MPHANIIAVANPKGGVAKTTTVSAFASGLKRRGFRVLAIDLSPNGNLSDCFGVETDESITIYEVLKKEKVITAAIQSHEICNIVPANISLSLVDQNVYIAGMEKCLAIILEPIVNSYDYIIIDTPPGLGVLTISALTAAQKIIIPCTSSVTSTYGISSLLKLIAAVKRDYNRNLEIDGILRTMFNPNAPINNDIRNLINPMNARIYKTYIRSSKVVDEAQWIRRDIYKYDKKSNVAMDYEKFIDEFLASDDNKAQAI